MIINESVATTLRQRRHVLSIASQITAASADSAAVADNTRALLAWIEATPTETERDARYAALDQAHDNLPLDPDPPAEYLDDPARLIAAAEPLCAVLLDGLATSA